MTQTRVFPCPAAQEMQLIEDVAGWLQGQDFRCQKLKTEDGGTLLQIEKNGQWRKFIGTSTAVNIVFRQTADLLNVEVGAGRWIDKAAAGTVSMFVLWPLFFTSMWGVWQQAHMPDLIYGYIKERVAS